MTARSLSCLEANRSFSYRVRRPAILKDRFSGLSGRYGANVERVLWVESSGCCLALVAAQAR
jgi:hypothetical protein